MTCSVARGIKNIISEKGLIQKVVAQRAGFTEQQLSDMLNGRKVIRVDYLPSLAKSLVVKISDIYDAGKCED